MTLNQNCVSYDKGRCLHQAAPRRLFGCTLCVLDWPNKDARVHAGCRLQVEHPRPNRPPPAPGAE